MDAGRRTPPSVSAWHRGKPGSGGPARPGLGAPRPPRPCPPPRAAPPQRLRPRGERCPAPARPGQPAGSLRCAVHIRKQPYKSRFRRRHPAPYLAIPAPAAGIGGAGSGSPDAGPRLPPGRARARPPPGRGSARLRRRAGGTEISGNTRVAPALPAAAASRAERPPRSRYPPPPRARGGAACRQLRSRDAGEFPGRWQRAPGGGCLLPEKGISGTSEPCRERLAPPAPAESEGALPTAPDRGRPRRCAPPARDGVRGTAKTRAPGHRAAAAPADSAAMESDTARDSALAP